MTSDPRKRDVHRGATSIVIGLLLSLVLSTMATALEGATTSTVRLTANDVSDPDPMVLFRVNAGGRLVEDAPRWRPDTKRHPSPFARGGRFRRAIADDPIALDSSVPVETPLSVLTSQRRKRGHRALRWHFPAEGPVEVRLYFVEIAARAQRVGERVFDVRVEGNTVANDLDVFAAAGANTATMRAFDVYSEGRLDIALRREVGRPAIAALEIVRLPDGSVEPPPPPPPPPPSGSDRPFSDTSAWNVPIPRDPVLAPNSRAIASYLSGARGSIAADLYEFGVPVYDADASTPRYNVECTKPWGPCGLEDGPVPIPDGARPAPGSDAHMAVVDESSGRVYEFWQARHSQGKWSASFGAWSRLDGSGHPGSTGDSRDAQVSLLAGTVRAREIESGVIDHALVFSSDNVSSKVQYPATKSSQRSSRSDALTMGQRIQLDPSIDVDSLPGITRGEKAVAVALQRYGAYVIDGGGARMAFIFENPFGERDPYPAAGLPWDYYNMPHIPWDRLRVLQRWDGT